MIRKQASIDCPIFQDREWTIEQLTRDLNGAKDPRDKVERAGLLRDEVKKLMECDKKDLKNPACEACQTLAKTRSEVAALVIRANRLFNKV